MFLYVFVLLEKSNLLPSEIDTNSQRIYCRFVIKANKKKGE